MDRLNLSGKKAKGRILRVKQGYNPNSSTMGSIVSIFPAALLAVTVGFGTISGVIMSAFIKRSDKTNKNGSADNPEKQGEK